MSTPDPRFDCNGMSAERYNELMENTELLLTEEELRAGWYWSPAWDGLLVHKTWHEARFDYWDEARFDYPQQEEMP